MYNKYKQFNLENFGVTVLLLLSLTACTSTPIQESSVPTSSASLSSLSNPSSPFKVDISSKQNPVYIGQHLNLQLLSMSEGYASLYAIHSSGKTCRLLENKRIEGGISIPLPSRSSLIDYQLEAPEGTESYVLLVTRSKLNWLAPSDKGQFYYGMISLNLDKTSLVSRLKQAVSRLPSSDWNIDIVNLKLVKN